MRHACRLSVPARKKAIGAALCAWCRRELATHTVLQWLAAAARACRIHFCCRTWLQAFRSPHVAQRAAALSGTLQSGKATSEQVHELQRLCTAVAKLPDAHAQELAWQLVQAAVDGTLAAEPDLAPALARVQAVAAGTTWAPPERPSQPAWAGDDDAAADGAAAGGPHSRPTEPAPPTAKPARKQHRQSQGAFIAAQAAAADCSKGVFHTFLSCKGRCAVAEVLGCCLCLCGAASVL